MGVEGNTKDKVTVLCGWTPDMPNTKKGKSKRVDRVKYMNSIIGRYNVG